VIFLTSVSELNGEAVIGAGVFTIGEVEGVEFDTKSWKIKDLQVKLTSEATERFGSKKPTFKSCGGSFACNSSKRLLGLRFP
jgi:sporulation protein YlmC with PRC-barrel domain